MAPSTLKTGNPKIDGKTLSLSSNHAKKSDSSHIKMFSTVFSDNDKITKKLYNENSKKQLKTPDHVILTHDHITLPFYSISMHIFDYHYTLNMLVDSGSIRSILPRQFAEHITSDEVIQPLLAVNHTSIKVYGELEATVVIHGIYHKHTFLVADIGCSILGFDFLALNGYSIQCRPLRLVQIDSNCNNTLIMPTCSTNGVQVPLGGKLPPNLTLKIPQKIKLAKSPKYTPNITSKIIST